MKKLLGLCLLMLAMGAGMIYLGVMPQPFYEFVDDYIPALSDAVGELGTLREGEADSAPIPAAAAAAISSDYPSRPEEFPLIINSVVEGGLAHQEAIAIPVVFPEGNDDEVTDYFLRQVELAIDHMRRNRPDIFWMSLGSYNIEWSGNRTTREGYLTVHLSYCHTAAQAQSMAAQMEAIVNGIMAGAPSDPAYAVEYFHDWIVAATVYDSKLAETGRDLQGYEYGFNIDGIFIHGSAVCEGYSKAFKLLCDRMGIPCESVFGVANGENHSWNYVQLDGKWYLVDATWDDPVGSEDMLVWDYCLKGSESLIDGVPVYEIYKQDYADYPALARNGYYEEYIMRSFFEQEDALEESQDADDFVIIQEEDEEGFRLD